LEWEINMCLLSAVEIRHDGPIVLTGLLLMLLLESTVAQTTGAAFRVDSVFAMYDNTRSPGCAVGVIHKGEFVFRRGYGMANLEYGIPLASSSVFRIGSTSKQFTAAAMVLLAQDGRISLNDDIRKYLPELPDYGVQVTIRHLLHHTSGIRDYLTLAYLAGLRDDDFFTDEDVVTMLSRQRELNFSPGGEHLYSNSGYFLLSQIVKRVTGVSLKQYAQERLFGPLGMANTHFHDDHTHIVPQRATGYAPSDSGFRISITTLEMVGDGGIFTSVDDLLEWDRFFYAPSVYDLHLDRPNDFWTVMLTRGVLNKGDTLNYALGLTHGEYRGLKVISHGGAFVGFRAEMMRFPEQSFTVICLCNLSRSHPTALARQVADIYLGDLMGPKPDPQDGSSAAGSGERESEPLPLSPGQLAEYTGTYYSAELDVTYRISLANGDLRLEVGNDLDGRLRRSAVDRMRRGGVTLQFQRDADGMITGFVLDAGRVKNLGFTLLSED
jgi:CubicO group peptidase (beta-lactamase class C family)